MHFLSRDVSLSHAWDTVAAVSPSFASREMLMGTKWITLFTLSLGHIPGGPGAGERLRLARDTFEADVVPEQICVSGFSYWGTVGFRK